MKLSINIDPELDEESMIVNVRQISEQVERIRKIVDPEEKILSRGNILVFSNDRQYILAVQQISHVFIDDGKTFVVSGKNKYILRESLSSFEKQMGAFHFVRISKFCLANMDWMSYFEAGFSGGLLLVFKNGWKESVSRKYVANLKKKLF
jgi:DNA-binding LytR/AlgR family response regulator